MKLTLFTLLLLVLSVIQIVLMLRNASRGTIGLRSALVIVCIWAAVGVVAVFPDLLNVLSAMAGLENRLFFAILIAIVLILQLTFRMMARMERMQRALDRLTQEAAVISFTQERALRGSSGAPAGASNSAPKSADAARG